MRQYSNTSRSNNESVNPRTNIRNSRLHVRQAKAGSQAKNMRLIGTISAIVLIITGFLFVIYYLKLYSALPKSQQDNLILLIPVGIVILGVLWQAFFWYVIFHSGGEHLEKMEQIINQNSQMLRVLTKNLDQTNEKVNTVQEIQAPNQIKGSCPFCGHPVSSTHPGIHTCQNCKNRFQL